ncbi:MAG: hypothetical protein KatS3mg115_1227 [Candidatus Poribacteria bacterium]|nr:MAG: hypothetical protein KatS3mg115_1227 [Candidatus Poribacteria bacterium]
MDFRNDEGTYTNLDLYAQRLSPEGVSLWSPEGAPLAVVPEIQQTPRLIPGRSGAALVVWTDARDVYEDLYVQRLTPDGISGEPNGRPLCRAGGRQREPAIAYDGRTFWVVWYDYRREYDEETYQDLYVQRLDARGNYLEAVEGVPFWTEPGQRTGLVLRAQAGVAVVAWTEIRGSESDVFAARIEATEP